MQRFFVAFLCGFVGLIIGYYFGASLGCDWLFPKSNLCGIYGLLTGPAGFVIGLVIGWKISRGGTSRS